VVCPSCQANLVVDPKTGLVLHSEGKKPDYSFDQALDHLQSRKEQSDELFQKAFQELWKKNFRKLSTQRMNWMRPIIPWNWTNR